MASYGKGTVTVGGRMPKAHWRALCSMYPSPKLRRAWLVERIKDCRVPSARKRNPKHKPPKLDADATFEVQPAHSRALEELARGNGINKSETIRRWVEKETAPLLRKKSTSRRRDEVRFEMAMKGIVFPVKCREEGVEPKQGVNGRTLRQRMLDDNGDMKTVKLGSGQQVVRYSDEYYVKRAEETGGTAQGIRNLDVHRTTGGFTRRSLRVVNEIEEMAKDKVSNFYAGAAMLALDEILNIAVVSAGPISKSDMQRVRVLMGLLRLDGFKGLVSQETSEGGIIIDMGAVQELKQQVAAAAGQAEADRALDLKTLDAEVLVEEAEAKVDSDMKAVRSARKAVARELARA